MTRWTDVSGVEHELTDQDRLDSIRVYIGLFAARTSAYSVWVGEPHDGKHIAACAKGCDRCSWMAKHRGTDEAPPDDLAGHTRAPLTPEVVMHAFASKRPVSAYMLGEDSTTHVMALDVDLPDGLLVCDRVARAMKRTGIPAYVEPSRRGGHLWVTLERALPGIVVRRALRALLEAADVEPDPKIELRPGQDRLSGPDGLGNALRMPLMPHQATGKRPDGLMAPGGRIVAATIPEIVQVAEPAPAAIVEEWSERWQPAEPIVPPTRDPEERPSGITRFNDEVGVTEVLVRDWNVLDARPGKAVRCPSAGHGGPDRNPSLSVMRDDRRVFCHKPECDMHNSGRGRDAYDLAAMAGTIQRGAA